MFSMSSTGWLSSSQEAVISAEMWDMKVDREEDGENVLKWLSYIGLGLPLFPTDFIEIKSLNIFFNWS